MRLWYKIPDSRHSESVVNIPHAGPIGLFSDLVSDHYRASAPRPAPPLLGHVTGIIQNISLMCINTKTGQLPAQH